MYLLCMDIQYIVAVLPGGITESCSGFLQSVLFLLCAVSRRVIITGILVKSDSLALAYCRDGSLPVCTKQYAAPNITGLSPIRTAGRWSLYEPVYRHLI